MAYIGEMQYLTIGNNTYSLPTGGDGGGGIDVEVDPVFSASPAAGITAADIANWNGKSSTDTKVTQTVDNTTNSQLSMVFSPSNSTATEELKKTSKLTWSPTNSTLTVADKTIGSSSISKVEINPNWLMLYNSNGYYARIALTSGRTSSDTLYLPNKNGTIALTSDIPTETTVSGWGFTKNAGTLTGVTFAGTSMSVSSGVASITQANARTALGLATVATSGSYNDLTNKPTLTDTKNTAGSTNSTSQLYLIGATEQSANPQTYSNNGLYINNEGTLITQSLTSYGSVGFSPGTSEYTFDNSYFNLSTKVYTQEAVSDSVRGAFIGGDYTGLTIGSYKGNNYSGITTYLRVSSEDETVEITNLSAPTTNTDAATKKYVDDSIGALTIPTKTSDLTNDSGFITSYTDEKLKWTASTSSNTYYPLQSTSTATTSTANTLNGISFYQYYNTAGGYRRLDLGNSTAYKSTGGAYGTIRLYGAAATYYGDLVPGVLGTTSGDGHISANRIWTLPDKTGTIALTSDIPSIPTSTGNATTGITASTTATKTTLGTAFTIPNVTSAGSASTWTFGATTVGDGTLVGAVDSSDTSMLVITAGTKSVQQKTGGANGSAPTLGTAFTVPNVTGNTSATVSISDSGHTHTLS